MKKILFLLILVTSQISIYGQKTFVNKAYDFQIQEPEKWIEANNSELLKIFGKVNL